MLNQSSPINELPQPDPASEQHMEAVQQHIIQEIDRCGGRIPFSRFMELALYAPGLGYYSAGNQKFGEAGDFVTAPEISPLFSRTLARQVAQILDAINGGTIIEFGAGQGTMAADMMAELERIDSLPECYQILEVSADLRQRQQQTIRQKTPHLFDRFQWLEQMPEKGFRGVVVANELLDAMPVTRFVVDNGNALEIFITWNGESFETTADQFISENCEKRAQQLVRQFQLYDGYSSEINLHAENWISSVGEFIDQGAAIIIDYGFPEHEYYHPQRNSGTIMCHYRHRSHPNPLIFPGIQDITAHVDFTAMATAAVKVGMAVRGYTSQVAFLMGAGITSLIPEAENEMDSMAMNQAMMKLTSPSEMGALFKVLILGKGVNAPLIGTSLRDDRARL